MPKGTGESFYKLMRYKIKSNSRGSSSTRQIEQTNRHLCAATKSLDDRANSSYHFLKRSLDGACVSCCGYSRSDLEDISKKPEDESKFQQNVNKCWALNLAERSIIRW